MVIERSRAWVKARIPAFICKETNWWVSRWIQTNVFLCPHCKQEYRSLKKVWDCLDEWEEGSPDPECTKNFSETFREQYPSAFRDDNEGTKSVLEPWYGKAGLAGGVLAVGIAFAVLTHPDETLVPGGAGTVGNDSIAQTEANPKSDQVLVADGTAVDSSPAQGAQLDTQQDDGSDLISPPETTSSLGSRVRLVNYDNSYRPAQPRAVQATLGRHLIEINSHPVAGFSTLTEDAY